MADTSIKPVRKPPQLAAVKWPKPLAKPDYEARLSTLQIQLLQIQQAMARQGRRAVLVLEGADSSGKGGLIRRLTRHLDPRAIKVWSIAAPHPDKQARHYLYRFWEKVPAPGEISVFDRSWYGRVLVERVEALVPEPVWQRAYRELSEFERLLYDDGVVVIKLFLHISREEQGERFLERLRQPHKRWKLTLDDFRNRRQWDVYQQAFQDMLDRTTTAFAPWTVIPANDKKRARILALEAITERLGHQLDLSTAHLLDPAVAQAAAEEFGGDRVSQVLAASASEE